MSQVVCGNQSTLGIDVEILFHPQSQVAGKKETKLLGIVNAQLFGWTAEVITDDSFDRKIAGQILGSLSYDPAQYTINMRAKDPSQELLRIYSKDRIEFKDMWVIYNTAQGHFATLDLASDPCGVFGISGHSAQPVGRNDLQQVQFNLVVNGATAQYEYHTDDILFELAAGVLTATDVDFTALRFRKGMSIIIETHAIDTADPFIRTSQEYCFRGSLPIKVAMQSPT